MLEKVGTEKTRSEALAEIADWLQKIMSESFRFRYFLHDEERPKVTSLEEKYRGKPDSDWTLEDIKQAERLIRFWTAEIVRLEKVIKVFTDVSARCRRKNLVH